MMASAIKRFLYQELFGLARRLLARLETFLNRDLDQQIEGQERLGNDLDKGASIDSLEELKSAPAGHRTVALDPPGPEAKKRTENRIPKIKDKRDVRIRFWIGVLLLVFLLAVVVAVIYFRSPASMLASPDLMRVCTGLGLLIFVLAIALIVPAPPPLAAIVLRYALATSVGLMFSSVPGTFSMDISDLGEASGGLAGFILALIHTPRPLAV